MRLGPRHAELRRHDVAAEIGGAYEVEPDPALLLARARELAGSSERIKTELVMTWLDMQALGGIPAITGWSPVEWLQLEAGLSRFEAYRLVRMASRLQTLQHTLGLLAAGQIGFEQAAVICAETTKLRGEVLFQVERLCCDQAVALNERGDDPDIYFFVQEAVEDARKPRDVERVERRAVEGQDVFWQQDFDGGGLLVSRLGPLGFDTAVRGIEDAAGRPMPGVSRKQQRAEGLVAMAAGWLAGGAAAPTPAAVAAEDDDAAASADTGDTAEVVANLNVANTDDAVDAAMTSGVAAHAGLSGPRHDGEHPELLPADERAALDTMVRRGAATAKPSVTVVVDLEKVEGPYLGELLQSVGRRAPRLSARLVDTLMCDVDLVVQLTEGRRPLVELKDQDTVPAATRRAVIIRDRGCRWPSCARPAWMSDVHHIRHQEDGGDHHPDNLVVLCRVHHGMLHGTHWTATLDGRTAAFSLSRRADGAEPQHVTYPRGVPPPVAVLR